MTEHRSGELDLERLTGLAVALVRDRYTPARARTRARPLALAQVHGDALRQLSTLFTSDREELRPGYLSLPRFRAAYLLYFVPTGVATMAHVLTDARALEPLGRRDTPVRVLDLGAGPLTASLAVASLLPAAVPLEVTALDGARQMMEDGKTLLEALRPGTGIRLHTGNLRDGGFLRDALVGRYDLVLLGNILNEWRSGGGGGRMAAEVWLERLLGLHLADHGVAALVEPATRSGSHHLIEVREHLMQTTDLRILAPCMGRGPCPLATASKRDWCHSEQPWRRPDLLRELDEAIGHRRASLKCSRLVLVRGEEPKRIQHRYRVIGGAMVAEGFIRRYLCGPDGRVVAIAPTGRSTPSIGIAEAWRGDVLDVPGAVREVRRGPRTEVLLEPGPRAKRLLGRLGGSRGT